MNKAPIFLMAMFLFFIFIPTIKATSCSPELSYRCDPSDSNVIQKCIGGVWTGWQSCTYGCNPSTGSCYPANGCFINDTYQCSPSDSNLLQKCVNNIWINWQSCAYSCNYLTNQCGSPPTTTTTGTTSTTTTLPGEITTTTTTTIPVSTNMIFFRSIPDSHTGESSYGLWSTNKYVYRTDRDNSVINQFNKTTLDFITSLAFSPMVGGTWNGTHNFIVNDSESPSSNIYIYDESFSIYYNYWNTSNFCTCATTYPMTGLAYDYKENVIWANCFALNTIFKLSATNGSNLGNMTYGDWIPNHRVFDLDFDGTYLLLAQYWDSPTIWVVDQTKALIEGELNQSDVIAGETNVPTNVGSVGFANGMLLAGPDYITHGYFWEYNYSINLLACGPENSYRCKPLDNITLQKCVNNAWTGWSSCAYGCSGNSCNSPNITGNITTYCYGEGSYQCSPLDNTTLQKCINNIWTGWQSCAMGCDRLTLKCAINYTVPTTISGTNNTVPYFDFGTLGLNLDFLNVLVTPFVILSFVALGVSGYAAYKVGGPSAGQIFGICMMAFILIFTYFGIYPLWIGFILAIFIALWIAKTFGVIGGSK